MTEPAPPPRDERDSTGDLLERVLRDGEAFVRAQIALYRHEALYAIEALRTPIALALLAALLGVAALILLLVAAVFALAPLTGPGWAALIVSLLTAAAAGALGWWVARRGKRVVAEMRKPS